MLSGQDMNRGVEEEPGTFCGYKVLPPTAEEPPLLQESRNGPIPGAFRDANRGVPKLKRIAVTGGSGFVGRHLIHELLARYPDVEITSVSRSEGAISYLLMTNPTERLRIAMADIRDPFSIKRILKGMDTVVHLAAMKRVELAEAHSREAVTVNVLGTINVLDAFEGNSFVLMSTDKAVEPCNCYGATKFIAEKLVFEHGKKQSPTGRYMVLRPGNILNSTGSVLELWRHQIETNNEITITDPNMTRYLTSVDAIVRLTIAMLEKGENGKVYVIPRGKAVRVGDLAKKIIQQYGDDNTRIVVVGKRPGERMHERLRGAHERNIVCGFEDAICSAPEVVEQVAA